MERDSLAMYFMERVPLNIGNITVVRLYVSR